MPRNGVELVHRIGHCPLRQRCLEQPLRNQVDEAPVRRGSRPPAASQITDVARALQAVKGPMFGFAQHFGSEHRLEAVRAHFEGGDLGEVGRIHGDRGGGSV